MTNIKAIISVILILAGLTSCQTDIYYADTHEFRGYRWAKTDTVCFQLPETFAATTVEPIINIRTDNAYAYRNLHLLTTVETDGHILHADTIHFEIYDKNGYPKGKGFPLIEQEKIRPVIDIDSASAPQIRIIQLMPDTLTEGITSVGLQLKRIESRE